jgi:hypothetical protein
LEVCVENRSDPKIGLASSGEGGDLFVVVVYRELARVGDAEKAPDTSPSHSVDGGWFRVFGCNPLPIEVGIGNDLEKVVGCRTGGHGGLSGDSSGGDYRYCG